MDPNANLQSQAYLISGSRDSRANARLRELRTALLEWMQHGGFEPDWAAYPDATAAFNTWRIRTIGY